MRNLFLKHCAILFGLSILVSSCSSDDISEGQLKVTENFNYQKFYEDYKAEIHKLNREEFAGLNANLRIIAYQGFSNEKKASWWIDKLENTLKLESLTNQQKKLISMVKEKFTSDFFDLNKNELLKAEVLRLVEENAPIVGFDNEMTNNIFMNLGDLNEDVSLKQKAHNHQISTKSTFQKLSNNSQIDMNNYRGIGSGPVDYSGEPNCSNYSCNFCSPAGGCDCSSGCKKRGSGCGIGGVFSCDAICCP